MVQKLLICIAATLIAATVYRVATRPFRIAEIDHELGIGYATDRWGEPSDPNAPDAGVVWRESQVAGDYRTTWLLVLSSFPAGVFLAFVRIRYRKDKKTARTLPD